MAFPVLPSVNDWLKKSKQHPDRVVEKYLRAIYDAQTIYERFDGLIELLYHCDEHEKDHKNYTRLKKTVLDVIGYIINDDNVETIREKITARVVIRDFAPFFMPWLRPAPQGSRYLVKDFGTSKSPKSTRQRAKYFGRDCPASGTLR